MAKQVNVTLRESSETAKVRTKLAPQQRSIPMPFTYTASDDGTDENLLVLLHGLGDTHLPFAKLGASLKLPQTATLALRALQQIPYLDEPAFQWFPAFDHLGETILHPNPTPAIGPLVKVLHHLVFGCGWPPNRIHLFGFGQGGTAALELALHIWRTPNELPQPALPSPSTETEPASTETVRTALGSAVSVAGPLLSFPTTLPAKCPAPILLLSPATVPPAPLAKGFADVRCVRGPPGERMPASRAEWEPIMRFWSQHLSRRMGGEGLYEVLTGTSK